MAVFHTRRPGEDISGAYYSLPRILDQHGFAFEHHHQLVLPAMPVPL